jgi:hypothetical protein
LAQQPVQSHPSQLSSSQLNELLSEEHVSCRHESPQGSGVNPPPQAQHKEFEEKSSSS